MSNTFAAALWTVDYMHTLASKGAIDVNFHDGGDDPHTPVAHTNGAFVPRPIYYAMLLFAKDAEGSMLDLTQGPGDSATLNLNTYAVKGSDGKLMVTLVNKIPNRLCQAVRRRWPIQFGLGLETDRPFCKRKERYQIWWQ